MRFTFKAVLASSRFVKKAPAQVTTVKPKDIPENFTNQNINELTHRVKSTATWKGERKTPIEEYHRIFPVRGVEKSNNFNIEKAWPHQLGESSPYT
jgi:hypothetical protein